MKLEFVRLEDDSIIEFEDVTSMMSGGKYYWLSFSHAGKCYTEKLLMSEYIIWSAEA